jgi:hypothetical protein
MKHPDYLSVKCDFCEAFEGLDCTVIRGGLKRIAKKTHSARIKAFLNSLVKDDNPDVN